MTTRPVKPPPRRVNLSDDQDDDDNTDVFSRLAAANRPKQTSKLPTTSSKPSLSKSPPPTTKTAGTQTTPSILSDNGDDDEEEDDYLSMTLPTETSTTKETPLQRLQRRKKEAELRGRPLSKAALAEQERLKRDIGLSTSLLESNASSKGLKMMQKMGFAAGGSLGKAKEGDVDEAKKKNEPLRPVMMDRRTGIGHAEGVKRKFAETLGEVGDGDGLSAGGGKRVELSPESYRSRLTMEAAQRRHEAQLFAAQSICEKLVADDPPETYFGEPASSRKKSSDDQEAGEGGEETEQGHDGKSNWKPEPTLPVNPSFTQIKQINIIYRGLLYRRALSQLKARLRKDFDSNAPAKAYINNPILPTYNATGEFSEDDKLALGVSNDVNNEETMLEEEVEDAELEEFEKREVKDRLDELVGFLRGQWRYCFWCKRRYGSDEELREWCPGVTEEEHD